LHPVLVDFGRFKLYSYGLALFAAFVIAMIVAVRREKKFGLPEGTALDFSMAIIISSLIGSRTLYVLTHLEEFRGHWLDIINPIQSDGTIGIAGMVLLGGVVLATATVLFMAWLRNLRILSILDMFAPTLALGIGIGRIGCFFNGCCFGTPTNLPWGMVFPPGSIAGSVFPGQHIHPTQLYAVLYGLLIFTGILIAERKHYFPGFSTSLFLVFYGIFRTLNETIRWQESGLRLIQWNGGMLTISQAISIFLVIAVIILFFRGRRKIVSGNPDSR